MERLKSQIKEIKEQQATNSEIGKELAKIKVVEGQIEEMKKQIELLESRPV